MDDHPPPGIVLYFTPVAELASNQRQLLAIFVSTILALVVRPAPMGVVVLIAMTLIALTGTLPLSQALSGFSSPTVWLIFSAFLFAQAVTQTRLGLRIAYFFISRLGTRRSLSGTPPPRRISCSRPSCRRIPHAAASSPPSCAMSPRCSARSPARPRAASARISRSSGFIRTTSPPCSSSPAWWAIRSSQSSPSTSRASS